VNRSAFEIRKSHDVSELVLSRFDLTRMALMRRLAAGGGVADAGVAHRAAVEGVVGVGVDRASCFCSRVALMPSETSLTLACEYSSADSHFQPRALALAAAQEAGLVVGDVDLGLAGVDEVVAGQGDVQAGGGRGGAGQRLGLAAPPAKVVGPKGFQ
jgi:hypothetical protein